MHGYLSSGASFYYQTEYLKKEFNVYAPDLVGFGSNQAMDYPYSLDDYIESVKRYMQSNDIVRPHVIAHSFGARIVLKSASQNPDLFDKIVITGGAGLKPKPTLKKTVKRLTFNLLKRFIGKKRLKRFYSKDYLALNLIMQQSFIKIVNEHLDGCIDKITNSTLLIYGKHDKQTPLYMAYKLHDGIKNSKLKIFDAGHFAFIDCPLKFNMEVREFLLS